MRPLTIDFELVVLFRSMKESYIYMENTDA